MTCIVGVTDGKTVTIGGDSAGVWHLDIVTRADLKVWSSGEWVFGFCGSFRMGQLLRYSLVPPVPMVGQDIDHFMVTTFINAVRQTLKDGGYARSDDGEEQGGDFLVGYQGQLYSIESDYQVGQSVEDFHAIGCGEPFARGALYALPSTMKPKARVRKALEVAAECSGGVRGPFHIVSSKESHPERMVER